MAVCLGFFVWWLARRGFVAGEGNWLLTVEMALERVGLGAVFLAPNKRFMLLVWGKGRRNAGK